MSDTFFKSFHQNKSIYAIFSLLPRVNARVVIEKVRHILIKRYLERNFDPDFYSIYVQCNGENNAEKFIHYCKEGWKLGLDPNSDFSVSDYLADHSDVMIEGIDPFKHYLIYGFKEGRRVKPSIYKKAFQVINLYPTIKDYFNENYYIEQKNNTYLKVNMLIDYLFHGWRCGAAPYANFDPKFYLSRHCLQLPDLMSPLEHYVSLGKDLNYATSEIDAFHLAITNRHVGQDELIFDVSKKLISLQPNFLKKGKNIIYLARDFDEYDRWFSFVYHYKTLLNSVGDKNYKDILLDGKIVWSLSGKNANYDVKLRFSSPIFHEGELSLELLSNGRQLYILSFSIIPGALIASKCKSVILIARLQGVRGESESIRNASKDCNDISPEYLLFSCLKGISEALEVTEICGLSAEAQLSFSNAEKNQIISNYDRFFESLGMIRYFNDVYRRPDNYQERPLIEIKASHRRRANAKRRLKENIASTCRESLLS